LFSLVGMALVAGCATASEGTPNPDPDASSPGSEQSPPSSEDPSDGDLPSDGAPNIENPLDISRFLTDPCLALTVEQTHDLGVPQTGEASAETLGNVCTWQNPETRGLTSIAMIEKYRRGLSAAYLANEQGKYAYFEPLAPIEGYPAVAYDSSDERDRGSCALGVGVANDLMFELSLRLSTDNIAKKKDPCETAVVVAGMMLSTMKEGA
jgi:Protein of unknown function (DUF3558)